MLNDIGEPTNEIRTIKIMSVYLTQGTNRINIIY